MGLFDVVRVITGKLLRKATPLIEEKKLVRRKGTTFLETFHVKADKNKTAALKKVAAKMKQQGDLSIGHEVKFKPPGAAYARTGFITNVGKTHYTVEGNRNEKGEIPVHKVAKTEVISSHDYSKYVVQPVKKVNPKKTAEGPVNAAKNNLSAEELRRRKAVVEERLGFKEDNIINHESFVGPAIKIVSGLAKENGISVKVSNHGRWWDRFEDQHAKELLLRYMEGGMQAWRRVLSEEIGKGDAGKQTKNNIKEFKDVIAGKKKSSYAHMVMQEEGRFAAIRYLQKRRADRAATGDMDIHDMGEDPVGRKFLERNSSQPMQFKYAMAANKEGLQDDLKKIVASMDVPTREVLRYKFEISRQLLAEASNDVIAEHMNERGIRHADGGIWTRAKVGKTIADAMDTIRNIRHVVDAYEEAYTIDGKMKPLSEWDMRDQKSYNVAKRAADLDVHMDELMGRRIYNAESPAGAVHMAHQPEEHGEVKKYKPTKAEAKQYRINMFGKSIPCDFHPEGEFTAYGIDYVVAHEGADAVLMKAERDGVEIADATFDVLMKAMEDDVLIKSIEEEWFSGGVQ